MKQAAKQIAILAAALFLICILCRVLFFRTYTLVIPLNAHSTQMDPAKDLTLKLEDPDVIDVSPFERRDGYLMFPVSPRQPGRTWIDIKSGDGENLATAMVHVDPFMTVYDRSTGGFTGDSAVLAAVTLFWLLTGFIMVWHFSRSTGPSFYAYATIYYAGFAMFALVTFVVMFIVTVRHIAQPFRYSMLSAYTAIEGASMHFLLLTTPLIVVFAVAMAVSNIALLRHERPRLKNFLGIGVSLLLLLGTALGWYFFTRVFQGSEAELRAVRTVENVYATFFAYFECMLAGSILCGVRAAKYEPAKDKDFIVILGCWFRKDGTLPPLLRGRADKAVAFWKKQVKDTGKEAYLIPSGGQGRDECMPEAQAIRNYLLTQGIPEDRILCEDKSRNTFENMSFSKVIANEQDEKGRVAFSTTNYHVFRSGIYANLAHFPAEGMGSGTKWWFWPNAFMRECVGLMQNRWKQELLMLFLLIAFFGTLSMILV